MIFTGLYNIAKDLIEKHADVNAKNSIGETPLITASRYGWQTRFKNCISMKKNSTTVIF